MKKQAGGTSVKDAQTIAERVAEKQKLELVEVVLQKTQEGMALCIFIDHDEGVTLDDCERFHKAVQPLLDHVNYDYLEVSSPGVDRPIKTLRDFEKHKGDDVEVKLFAKMDGAKQFFGLLTAMDESDVTITLAGGELKTIPRKAVALIRPVIELSEE